MLTFRLGESVHALPIAAIEEVLPALPVEAIAQCPAFVRGVVFVRGHLIAVFSAAERLGLTQYRPPREPHILCLRWKNRLVGLEVDEALDLVELRLAAVLSAADMATGPSMLKAVVEHQGQIIRLLDPARLLSPGEAQGLEQLPTTQARTSS